MKSLHSTIDSLYDVCEVTPGMNNGTSSNCHVQWDEDAVECEEVSHILQSAHNDFQALIERFQVQVVVNLHECAWPSLNVSRQSMIGPRA